MPNLGTIAPTASVEFSLNVFTEFSDKNIYLFVITIKGLKPATCCISDQDATGVNKTHMTDRNFKFTEFLLRLGKTPMSGYQIPFSTFVSQQWYSDIAVHSATLCASQAQPTWHIPNHIIVVK